MNLELIEGVPLRLPREALPMELGEQLWRAGPQVAVDFPSPRTADEWQLTARGWAGFLSLPGLRLRLQPKVPIRNLFRLWEWAYDWPPQFAPELFNCASVEDAFESLAVVLARRVLQRARQGFAWEFVARDERLACVRGRLDLPSLMREPIQTRPRCHFQEMSGDIEDNRIVLWTLHRILSAGVSLRVRPVVREALGVLGEVATLQSCAASACVGRFYGRLNHDYQLMHALCRFFLEGLAPSQNEGEHLMPAFLCDMERVFESFAARWLSAHLPPQIGLRAQISVPLEARDGLSFRPDIVLFDKTSGKVLSVLDTKYQARERPSTEDIAQVAAYAASLGCHEAALLYPAAMPELEARVGTIRVRVLSFDLSVDVDEAGQKLLSHIFKG